MTDQQLATILQAVDGRQSERLQRFSGWVPVAFAFGSMLVGATAFLAPLRDDIDRIEAGQAQYEADNLQKILRLSERIDGVQNDLESSSAETAARLAAIQADVSVIKSRIDSRPR